MRKTIILTGTLIAAGLLLVQAPLKAHHSFAAAFDENKPINLQGKIVKVELVNPHTWLWIDVTDAEARALLLSIDPLAALAETQSQLHQRLLELTPVQSPELQQFWQAAADAAALAGRLPAERADGLGLEQPITIAATATTSRAALMHGRPFVRSLTDGPRTSTHRE